MTLSQPSRTIVVEPAQRPATTSAPAAPPPPEQPDRRIEEPAAPARTPAKT